VVLEDVTEPRLSLSSRPSENHELTRALLGLLSPDDLQQLRQRQHAARKVSDVDAWDL
jgi:hypothetical protein